MPTILQRLSVEMSDVADRVRRSLVSIQNGRRGAGAGSRWHSDGLILTNAHVVGSRSLEVTLPDGTRLPARVLAHDEALDLSAVEVDAGDLPTVPIGDSRLLRPGHVVMAMGHPWGVSGATTAGVVIGVGPHLNEGPAPDRDWVVAALRLRPGHSGGPMMDAQGRLVGINTMITGPEVAMAVPVHVAKTRSLRRRSGRSRCACEGSAARPRPPWLTPASAASMLRCCPTTATSAVQFYRSVGGALGLAVLGSFMASRFAVGLSASLSEAVKQALPPGSLDELSKGAREPGGGGGAATVPCNAGWRRSGPGP